MAFGLVCGSSKDDEPPRNANRGLCAITEVLNVVVDAEAVAQVPKTTTKMLPRSMSIWGQLRDGTVGREVLGTHAQITLSIIGVTRTFPI